LKKNKTFYLILLPLLFILVAVCLNNARGPGWLGSNLDPEYVYLLNAANLSGLKGVGHIDHPGTPVQILGAIVIRIVHFFNSPGISIYDDLLNRPEYYLSAVKIVLIFLNSLILLALGIVTYSVTRSLWTGLWLQMTPFLSIVIIQFGLTRMSPEPLLLFTSLAFIIMIVILLKYDSVPLPLVLGIALISGLGIAVKVTFIPLVILPFIVLPRLKNKLVYSASLVVGFIIFTIPIIRMYPMFFEWIYNLLMHSGHYGTGASRIVSFHRIYNEIPKLLVGNPFFFFVLIFTLIILVFVLLTPKLRKISLSNRYFKFLAGIAVSQITGLFIVAKHSSHHYLLPVISLSGFTLCLIYLYLVYLFCHFALNLKYLYFSAIILLATILTIINPLSQIIDEMNRLTTLKEKSLAINDHIQTNHKDYAKIYYYPSSSPVYALKFGNDLSRNYHARSLAHLYKNVFFYDRWRKKFYGFDYHQIIPFEQIQAKHGNKILFQGARKVKIGLPDVKLKQVYKPGFSEGVFIIDSFK